MKLWYHEHPELLVKIEQEIESGFPGLRVLRIDGKVCIRGRFDVFDRDVFMDSYGIEIVLADDHPKTLPVVFEIEGRVPRKPERHANHDGSACLFVSWERVRYWPDPTSISAFLRGPVNDFFLGQILYVALGYWPWGDRSHGILGITESIEEALGFSCHGQIKTILRILGGEPRGHWICPCGSLKRIRDCHAAKLNELRSLMGIDEVRNLTAIIVAMEKDDQLKAEKVRETEFALRRLHTRRSLPSPYSQHEGSNA